MVTDGGDNYITEKTMRMACGLPPMQLKVDGKSMDAQGAPLQSLVTSEDGAEKAEENGWRALCYQ